MSQQQTLFEPQVKSCSIVLFSPVPVTLLLCILTPHKNLLLNPLLHPEGHQCHLLSAQIALNHLAALQQNKLLYIACFLKPFLALAQVSACTIVHWKLMKYCQLSPQCYKLGAIAMSYTRGSTQSIHNDVMPNRDDNIHHHNLNACSVPK